MDGMDGMDGMDVMDVMDVMDETAQTDAEGLLTQSRGGAEGAENNGSAAPRNLRTGGDAYPTKPLCLDWLVEEKKPVGQIELLGERYDLMSVDVVEDFLRLVATCERARTVFQEKTADGAGDVAERLEAIGAELRSMILVLVPGLPEQVLQEKLPRISQLQQFFNAVVMEVQRRAPESVKKNLDGVQPKSGS